MSPSTAVLGDIYHERPTIQNVSRRSLKPTRRRFSAKKKNPPEIAIVSCQHANHHQTNFHSACQYFALCDTDSQNDFCIPRMIT